MAVFALLLLYSSDYPQFTAIIGRHVAMKVDEGVKGIMLLVAYNIERLLRFTQILIVIAEARLVLDVHHQLVAPHVGVIGRAVFIEDNFYVTQGSGVSHRR